MSTATETIIVQALANGNVHSEAPDAIARQIIDALEARGYALRKKPAPRKPAAPAEVFAPNTGNSELDAFMRTHHRPDWQAHLKKACARNRPGMVTMPAPAPGLPPKRMTQQERADLWDEHKVVRHSA